MPASSPISGKTDLVTFRIMASGAEINSTYQVLSIEVSNGVNRIGTARIELLDGNPSAEDFPISDSADFLPGTELTILAGYHTEDSAIFKGLVVKHALEVRSGQTPVLRLECRDAAAKMTVARKSAVFEASTDSDALTQIIGTYSGLTAAVDSTTVTYPELVQHYCTDWDFLVARAEANGLVVISSQGTVTVAKPDTSKAPVLEVTYGSSLNAFAVALDARSQYAAVKGQAWDYATQALLEAEGAAPGVTTPGNVTSATLAGVLAADSVDLQIATAVTQEGLKAWADALRLKSALAKVRGTVRFQGSSLAVPGSMLTLSGMGQRFNGNAYISGVQHRIADGDWETEVTLGLDEQWFTQQRPDAAAPPSAGPLPGIQGLYNAVVTQIHEDPNNQLRVQVTVPVLGSKNLWARLGHPYASSGNGSFFFPEVGDEVVLGFFNNDPQQPVLLGALYSSQRTAGYTPDATNKTKAWTTKSKLTLEFDDEKKIITLKTPGGNQIVISDDAQGITLTDQNSNKLTMSSSGVVLESASNMKLKAGGNLDLEATGNVTVKATADLALQGLNVAGTAQIQMKMAGNASAELSAAGQTTVKGAIVMIN